MSRTLLFSTDLRGCKNNLSSTNARTEGLCDVQTQSSYICRIAVWR